MKSLNVIQLTLLVGFGLSVHAHAETEADSGQLDASETGSAPSGPSGSWLEVAGSHDLFVSDLFSGLEGAARGAHQVCVDSIHRKIVHLPEDGTTAGWLVGNPNDPGDENPPIDLLGPRISTQGAFGVRARLFEDRLGGGYLDFYGELPTIQDEAKREGPRLSFGLSHGQLRVRIWNGRSGKPKTYAFGSNLKSAVDAEVLEIGNGFQIRISGKTLGSIPNPGVFASGTVFLGADVRAQGRLCVESFSIVEPASAVGKTQVVRAKPFETVEVPSDSLRALAVSRGIDIGTCVAINPLVSDPVYRKKLAENFSMITPENAMKFEFIHPAPGTYAFKESDAIIDFAKANHIKVHAHTLVWGESLPAWVTQGHYSNAELRKILEDHIRTVVGHFKGKVAEWDVLNEPLEDEGNLRKTIWAKAFGRDYPAIFFKWAHEIDPQAKLFINEFDAEEEDSSRPTGLKALVKLIRRAGGHVDGIGLQSHEEVGNSMTVVSRTHQLMKDFGAMGVETRISELDVGVEKRPSASDVKKSAEMQAAMLKACLDRKQDCHTVAVWGFTDRYSSMQDADHFYDSDRGLGSSMIMDADYQLKSSYRALQKALKP